MANYSDRNLTGVRIKDGYPNLVENRFGILTDGLGNSIDNILSTSSWALNAITTSFITTAQTASFYNNLATTLNTGSLYAITASSSITSSFASISQTASFYNNLATTLNTGSNYDITSSWAISGGTQLATGSLVPITASQAISSSWSNQAASASWSTNQGSIVLFVVTSSVGANNTSTETNFWTSSTVIANTPFSSTDIIRSNLISRIGKIIKINVHGYMQSSGTDSLRLRLYLGPNVIWDSTAITASSTVGNRVWKYDSQFVCNNILSLTGSLNGQGIFQYFTTPSSSISIDGFPNISSFLFDTTIDNEIRMTSQWGSSSLNNYILITDALCELKN